MDTILLNYKSYWLSNLGAHTAKGHILKRDGFIHVIRTRHPPLLDTVHDDHQDNILTDPALKLRSDTFSIAIDNQNSTVHTTDTVKLKMYGHTFLFETAVEARWPSHGEAKQLVTIQSVPHPAFNSTNPNYEIYTPLSNVSFTVPTQWSITAKGLFVDNGIWTHNR